jgi:methyltransferase
MTRAAIVAIVAFVPMVAEARRSRRHASALRAQGAIEPPGDVYRAMQIAYPGCFAALTAEAWARQTPLGGSFVAGAVVFALAKAVKYWAIATLGSRWTFRVLVPPGQPLISSGPYRVMRHPNYLGVAGEIAGAAMMADAPIAGVVSLLVFGTLLRARIRVEERALGDRRGLMAPPCKSL